MASLRMEAFAAEELSTLLIETYQNKQVPQMIEDFSLAGFTQSSLVATPAKLYLMIVTASYDRRPFTGAIGGYEHIWGMRKGAEASIPTRLKNLGLSDPNEVKSISLADIREQLSKESIQGHSLGSVERVDYGKTLLDSANCGEQIHRLLTQVRTSQEVAAIYNELTKVHGIGETIASKLIKYSLREIKIGKCENSCFPLTVVWPLLAEYHNEQAMIKIKKVGPNVVPLSMGLLLERGDPFAIDALFYLNRYEPSKLDDFVTDTKQWLGATRQYKGAAATTSRPTTSMEKAKLLMAVIKEVCEDIDDITPGDLKGLSSPQKVKAAARRLYQNMAGYAANGDIIRMHDYYKNCLNAKTGMEWDWLLESIGKKSLRSEWDRFNRIFHDMDIK